MKPFGSEVLRDLRRMIDYQVLQITLVLSVVFALMMALLTQIDVVHFISLSVFIVPIIMFSIAAFLRKEDRIEEARHYAGKKPLYLLSVHTISALIVEAIPFLLYSVVLLFVRTSSFSYGLYAITYFSGAILHVLISSYLAMSSKTMRQLAYGYIAYVLVFSMTPILYSNGIIPFAFQYWMLISPAYVSGLLIDNVLTGFQFSSNWLIALASCLQALEIVLLTLVALIPLYRRQYCQAQEERIEDDNVRS
jgi:hypothetical protein